MGEIEKKIGEMDNKIAEIEKKMGGTDNKMGEIDKKLDSMMYELRNLLKNN